MTNVICERVAADSAKAVSGDLGSWLLANPLPAFVEPKYDGTRVWLIKVKDEFMVATKHNGIYTAKQYPQLFQSLVDAKMPYTHLILDGELMKQQGTLAIFDVLHIGKESTAELPMVKRRQLLMTMHMNYLHHNDLAFLVPSPLVKSADEITEYYERYVIEEGFEGVVIKNPDSKYSAPNAWLKRKKYDTIDCVVTARDTEHEGYSFHIGAFDKLTGELIDMGKVGSFVKGVDCAKIAKGTVLEIQYQERTRQRHLRHPFVIRIRDDKLAKECVI